MANVIVLFEVTIKNGKMEDSLARAAQIKESLNHVPGFIRAERFSSIAAAEKLLSVSIWENEESVSKWRTFPAHRQSQQMGRTENFADYKITVVTPIRCYTMNECEKAPSDSNCYFNTEV